MPNPATAIADQVRAVMMPSPYTSRDSLDDAAECAAVLRRDAAGLDLHFLENFENRVLARGPVDDAVGGNSINRELIFRRTGTIHLEAIL